MLWLTIVFRMKVSSSHIYKSYQQSEDKAKQSISKVSMFVGSPDRYN
jgi:hypothetical protein